MIQKTTLLRSYNKVGTYIEKYVTRVGIENREEVLELFDNMHKLFPHWVIATCPLMHPQINYVSKNIMHVFGFDGNYLMENTPMDRYFSHVHDADQEDLHDCISIMHDFLEAMPPENHHNYRCIFHYRFKKGNGQYMYLHDERAALKLRSEGNLYYALYRDITHERPFTGVKMEMYEQEKVLRKIKEYKPSLERNRLSKREEELVTLIKQGLSTKEIAWQLSISPNTVRNIKSKLFEKFNVSNSIELLNMAG